MDRRVKRNPIGIIGVIFAICMVLGFFEYFVLRTDQSYIGENVFHKILGIGIIFIVIRKYGYRLYDIGFKKNKILSGLLIGTALFIVTYSISYIIEIVFLGLNGERVWLEFYSGGFSLTGAVMKNTALYFIVFTILVNLINSFMEEGIFRGIFMRFSREKYSFKTSNMLQASFFGLWHIVMPIRSVIDGEMTVSTGIIMCIGYIILSFIMGIKLGMLAACTGSLWAGFFEHTFNNSIVNFLHVVTSSSSDSMQIIRVIIAQILSIIIVYIIYKKEKKKYFSNKYKLEI